MTVTISDLSTIELLVYKTLDDRAWKDPKQIQQDLADQRILVDEMDIWGALHDFQHKYLISCRRVERLPEAGDDDLGFTFEYKRRVRA